MRMMKRPRKFTDPEDMVMSKITRGLSQSHSQPPQGVQERQSVLRVRQAPAQSFPLPTIVESPGNFVTSPITPVDYDIPSYPQPQLGVSSIHLQAPVTEVPQYSGQCSHEW